VINRREEVLTILQEECGEVIQAATKIIRFGLTKENKAHLENELGDILAMIKLVDEEIELDSDHMLECSENKLVKVEKFMNNKRDSK
jgi:hypothetical protein